MVFNLQSSLLCFLCVCVCMCICVCVCVYVCMCVCVCVCVFMFVCLFVCSIITVALRAIHIDLIDNHFNLEKNHSAWKDCLRSSLCFFLPGIHFIMYYIAWVNEKPGFMRRKAKCRRKCRVSE